MLVLHFTLMKIVRFFSSPLMFDTWCISPSKSLLAKNAKKLVQKFSNLECVGRTMFLWAALDSAISCFNKQCQAITCWIMLYMLDIFAVIFEACFGVCDSFRNCKTVKRQNCPNEIYIYFISILKLYLYLKTHYNTLVTKAWWILSS